MNIIQLALILLALPLFPIVLGKFLQSKNPLYIGLLSTTSIGIGLGISIYLMTLCSIDPALDYSFSWFTLHNSKSIQNFKIGIYIDQLTSLMLFLLFFISFCVHLYAINFLKKKHQAYLFFAYLSFFIMSMIGIILANSLLVIFIFWEYIGLSSYLLINFWYKNQYICKASSYTFLMSKTSDVLFFLGICIIWYTLGTLHWPTFHNQLLFSHPFWLYLGVLSLTISLLCKSAQFPFLSWLPKAMVAPTPVSALLHGATLVVISIYILIRVQALYTDSISIILVYIGAITAFWSAFQAFRSFHIKKMLAYSTASQVGYMIMAVGMKAYQASVYFLYIHAFAKSCLFLCAGIVLALINNNKQISIEDIRLMGGLRKHAPWLFCIYLIAACNIIGMPFFAGWYSKKAIMTATIQWVVAHDNPLHYIVLLIGIGAFLCTILYICKQFWWIFFGYNRYIVQKKRMLPIISASLLAFVLLIMSYNNLHLSYTNKLWLCYFTSLSPCFIPQYQNNIFTFLCTYLDAISLLILFLGFLIFILYLKTKIKFFTKINLFCLYINFYLKKIHKIFSFHTIVKKIIWYENIIILQLSYCLALGYITLGHIMAWIDTAIWSKLIDCIVILPKKFIKTFQKQKSKAHIQSYFLWLYISILLLFVLIYFFI